MTRAPGGGRHPKTRSGDRFLDRYRSSFDFQQTQAFRAIQRCAPQALGGNGCLPALRDNQVFISYNRAKSALPEVPAQTRQRCWRPRERELLATPPPNYFHVVFKTVPHELHVNGLGQRAFVLYLLFSCQPRKPLLEDRADPQTLGRPQIGVISVLHTWGQNMLPHPHNPWRHSRRRTIIGPLSLDPPPISFLFTSEDSQPRLSWKVSGRLKTSLPQQKIILRCPAVALADSRQFSK